MAAALAFLLALHRDLGLYLGNPEWDYVGQPYTRGEGAIERSASLADAVRPDGRYGPGIPLATWAVRAVLARAGIVIDAFRGAQLVTAFFSVLFLLAAWRLARALEIAREWEWIAVAALACAWPFFSLAVQVTADVPTGALLALAAVPLFGSLTPRRAAAAGALLGGAFLFRQSALAYLPIYLLVELVASPVRASLVARARAAAATFVGFAFVAAPRVIADYVQTGRLVHHDQAQVLRALLYEGGLEAFRTEPTTVLAVFLRDPARFAGMTASSLWFYACFLGPALVPALIFLLRDPASRGKGLVALLLAVGLALGVSPIPTPSLRYLLAVFPLAIVAVLAALDRALSGPARELLPKVAATGFALTFPLVTALQFDKYRFDMPEAEIDAALAAVGSPRPPILVRPGVTFDQTIYFHAVRYRLRRLDAHLVSAPRPLDGAELAHQELSPPLLVLRVPIPKTGPSIVLDLARGRPREVFRPLPDPCLTSAPATRLVFDPVSEIELWRVDDVPKAAGG